MGTQGLRDADADYRQWDDDGGFFAKDRCGEPEKRRARIAVAVGQRVDKSPQRTCGGEYVGLRQRALCEPDGIGAGEDDRPERDDGRLREARGEAPNCEQAQGGYFGAPTTTAGATALLRQGRIASTIPRASQIVAAA